MTFFRAALVLLLSALCIAACDKESPGSLQLTSAFVGTNALALEPPFSGGLPVDRAIALTFSSPVDPASAPAAIQLFDEENAPVSITLSLSNGTTVSLLPKGLLKYGETYRLEISNALRGTHGETFSGSTFEFSTAVADLELLETRLGGQIIEGSGRIDNVPLVASFSFTFSDAIDLQAFKNADQLTGPQAPSLEYSISADNKTITVETSSTLKDFERYAFSISNSFTSLNGGSFDGYSKEFYTGPSDDPKFPLLPTSDLLTLVQQQTFKYFYDFAHPASGMARERNTSGDLVTSGGSGFGIMALIVGIERGFISRNEGLDRMDKILDFLETADRFHGAWSHWINGNTGEVIPFSANDNGGDLVETSFLVQGLLTFRQYLNGAVPEEQSLIERINTLWQGVEWDWYTRGGQNVLYWHWSPDKEWAMNHQIKGYNEALITYVLAAASPTHSIDAEVYHEGWASNGGIVNGDSFYGTTLPLGFDYGGPLFFAHYSFLGLDPRSLSDTYGDYWVQNVNHTLINHQHSVVNPKNFVGYSDENWGLTASDNHQGYSAHSPTNDLGVISPTAALSSFPYAPEESLKALEFFYYKLGDRLWGPYGFYDAFNLTEGWVADSYLAIDQGPIIVMIENYRTGLLWDLFMSAPEVQQGLDKLSFTY